ncbi:MAG TPA: cytochrome c biogenesis protein CcdC [Pseudogracilibacillus sp.]|nr:cytochrome c biogenesis protein CcdC [Pseudogracilibacillus sp.]
MSIELNETILVTASSIIAVFMATTMIFVRMKAAKKPTSSKKIILPPIFMSSGACMFLFPEFRLSGIEIIEAVLVGALFSILLIKNTKFEIKQNDIFLIPSKSFIFILFGLLIVRTIIKVIVGSTISFGETSGMFFLLAFAMIVTWRIFMLKKYKKLANELNKIKTYA